MKYFYNWDSIKPMRLVGKNETWLSFHILGTLPLENLLLKMISRWAKRLEKVWGISSGLLAPLLPNSTVPFF